MRTCLSTARVFFYLRSNKTYSSCSCSFLYFFSRSNFFHFPNQKPWCDAFWTFAPYRLKGHEKSIDIRGGPIYGIYQSNAVTKNFFAGKTSIGTDGASVDGNAAANDKKGAESEDTGDAKQGEGDIVREGAQLEVTGDVVISKGRLLVVATPATPPSYSNSNSSSNNKTSNSRSASGSNPQTPTHAEESQVETPQYRAAVLGSSLEHEFVDSGNVILNGHGNVTVALTPQQSAVLRSTMMNQHVYTLTPIGGPAPGLYVARELSPPLCTAGGGGINSDSSSSRSSGGGDGGGGGCAGSGGILCFDIAGGTPGLKVSWVLRSFTR